MFSALMAAVLEDALQLPEKIVIWKIRIAIS